MSFIARLRNLVAVAPRSMASRRIGVIASLMAVVLLGVLLDSGVSRGTTAPDKVAFGAPVDAISSAWYCAATPALKSDASAGSIAILNVTDAPVSGTVSYMPITGSEKEAPFGVPGHSRLVLYPGDVVDSPFAGALVQVDGGGVAVEHSMRGPGGVASAPCSNRASTEWHIADATTLGGTTLQLALFNPFPDDAIADVDFVTSEGRASPQELTGVVVRSRSTVVVPLTETLRRRDWLTATAKVRTGRIVVDQLQTGSYSGAAGTTLTAASPLPSTQWFVPAGRTDEGVVDRISLYNPSEIEADVSLEVVPQTGPSIQFPLRVPAGGRIALNLATDDRVPKNVRYSVAARTVNGVGIVMARTATAVAPSSVTGAFVAAGGTAAAHQWAFALSPSAQAGQEWISIYNPGSKEATVRLSSQADGFPSPVGEEIVVPAGGHSSTLAWQPAPVVPGIAVPRPGVLAAGLLVESTQPVVVGREMNEAGDPSLAFSLGIPLS